MRIAHVTATFPPYYAGTGMVCRHHALGLAHLGHDVTVFTAGNSARRHDLDGIAVRYLPALFRFGNAPFLPGLLSLGRFDIIHLHHPFIFGSELIWLHSRRKKVPYVITHHNDLLGPGWRGVLFNAYTKSLSRLVFDGARRCLVVSLDHARHGRMKALISRQPPKFVELPNGVDLELFKPSRSGCQVRRAHGIPGDAPVLLFVGVLDRAHHYRRVDLLIKALKIIPLPGLHLIIVGNGDQITAYQDLAASLAIGSRVHFLGGKPHRELPPVYAACDVVVLPSHIQEACPLVLLEAMACGKPVIASNLPGVRSLLNGKNGLLVEPADLSDLAGKISTLVGDPALRAQMGAEGRAFVESRHAWPALIPRLERIYTEALAAP